MSRRLVPRDLGRRADRLKLSIIVALAGFVVIAVLFETDVLDGKWTDAWRAVIGMLLPLSMFVVLPGWWVTGALRTQPRHQNSEGRFALRSNRIALVAMVTGLMFALYAVSYWVDGQLSWTAALPVIVVVPLVWLSFVLQPPPAKLGRRFVGLALKTVIATQLVLLFWNLS
ncbi:MAG: hypothetical protein ACRDKJ_12215 [Actinomycetota bacterium]